MADEEIINIAKKFKEKLSGLIEFESIYLFGSYAKGKAETHSDIDIAVVVNKLKDEYMETVFSLWRISSKIDARLEPVLIIPDEDITGFYKEIQRTGIKIN